MTDGQRYSVRLLWHVPGAVQTLEVSVPSGATVADVLAAARALDAPDFVAQPAAWQFACFGRAVTLATVLQAGDRLEVCAPLPGDPRERRRARVVASRRARHTGEASPPAHQRR